ncbi:hypothetical protein [Gallaecimonas sp. GXIMD1310]|uniref:hypothetical protein n=1 Tax=Gallaecimonas sp. GXIMD1310 TaxID=3131926 RepID=UPI00324D0E54
MHQEWSENMFFPEENKWKNILLLSVFFILGNLLVEKIWPGCFVAIAILLSRVLAKKPEQKATFFSRKELVEYNSNYYSAFYRMLLSGNYVYVAFSHGHLITLDLAFFILWLVGYTLYWFAVFFIPHNGELSPRLIFISNIAAIVCIAAVLSTFIWIFSSVKGFSFISPIIKNAFEFLSP